jgi:hypothetical protein
MIPAVQAFIAAANAANAAYRARPAYVAYVSASQVSLPPFVRDRTAVQRIVLRTHADKAILTDLNGNGERIAHSFPLAPTFDALSDFAFAGQISSANRGDEFRVLNVRPLAYDTTKAQSRADVVAVSLKNYVVEYAREPADGDATFELRLHPTDAYAAQKPRMTLERVVVDGKTSLPRQVYFTGDGIGFRVFYEIDAAGWHASEMRYSETMRAPLGVARTTLTVEGRFSEYRVLPAVPDPRLAPEPAAPPPAPLPSGSPSSALRG